VCGTRSCLPLQSSSLTSATSLLAISLPHQIETLHLASNNIMAREFDQHKLRTYSGKFSYQPQLPQDYLKVDNSDYNHTNPETWPVMTSGHLDNLLGKTYAGDKLLPPFIAYDRKLVETCVSHWPDQLIDIKRTDGSTVKRSLYFYHFPFIYNNQGRLRPDDYIPAVHYASWVFSVSGKWPITRTKDKETLATSTTPFDEIIEMIRGERMRSTTEEIENLKQELAKAQDEAATEKLRADALEKARTDANMTHKKKLAEE
jgi:hypothetical protein